MQLLSSRPLRRLTEPGPGSRLIAALAIAFIINATEVCSAGPPNIDTKPASSAQQDGILFSQTSRLLGSTSVYLSARGVKVVDPKSGMSVVCTSPSWKVVMYNVKAKTIYRTELKNVRCSISGPLALFTGKEFSQEPVQKTGQSTVAGIKCSNYALPASISKKALYDFTHGACDARTTYKIDYRLAEHLPYPPQLGECLVRLYGIPVRPGFPLQYHFWYVDNEPKSILYTVQVKKQKIADAEFDIPTGYKPVKSDTEVRLDSQVDPGVADMFATPGAK